METQIKCAIIGLGRIASSLEDDSKREKPASHAGAIRDNPHTKLCGGYDREAQPREAFQKRWNCPVFDDVHTLLAETQPQILHICTHEDSHLDYLKLAVTEKIPVVVLEKPVSDKLGKAKSMVKRLGNTRVIVNHERRYSKDYLRVKEHIRTKTFGELNSITGRLYMGMKRSMKSMLLHDGTHMLDIMGYLAGQPLRKLHVHRKGSHNLYATALAGDIALLCEAGNRRDHLVFELELSFSKGRIRVGNGIYEEWESRESPYYEQMRSLLPVELPSLGDTEYFKGMLKDGVSLVNHPHRIPLSSYADGVKSLELVEMLRKKCP